MASRWAFQAIQDTVRNAGLVFMSDSFYGRQFELSPTRFDYDLGHEGSSTYRLSRSAQLFRPVIFGEVKEITGELSRHAITINLGLPQWAPHETDTLFWNQVAELGYTMRRESADNDSLTHMLPYEDHLPIHQIIPWSIGPNGDSWDRIFIQVAADCPIVRTLPSKVMLPSGLSSHALPTSPNTAVANFHAAIAAVNINVIPNPAALSSNSGIPATSSSSSDDDEFLSNSSSMPDLSSLPSSEVLMVGDFVVVVCDLVRIDYQVNNHEYDRVYSIDAVALNIIA
ncbi:hypothetical protein B0H10DRAFT_2368722 [Mycena sp. CBHHK59/15]|nr:hypothetical protein B0H10DRAFT_2368722 [Mycena sp. CBHHK59/15]